MRPEFVRLVADGPLRGRVLVDEYLGSSRCVHVETPHGTLFTDMVEPVMNTWDRNIRTVLVGVRRGGVKHPVICMAAILLKN